MKKYKLKGLSCASCAANIEEELKKHTDFASVNFTTSELVADADEEKVLEIVNKVEPEVEVVRVEDNEGREEYVEDEKEEEEEELNTRKEIVQMVIAGALLFLGTIFKGSLHTLYPAIEYIIFLSAYLIAGHEILLKALKNVARRAPFDENFLISVATIGAIAIHEMPEAIAVMLFFRVGEFMQDLAVNKSRRSIKSLLAFKAEYANLFEGEKILQVKPGDLRVGDIILIKPGERVPVDGVIIEGKSSVDTSALTGESVPRTVGEGDEILSGMVNLSGLLKVEVTKELSESTITRILELVENASARKAKTEKFITRFARYYTPAVIALAVLVAVAPPLLFGEPFSKWIYRALVLLVISCPCALVLSIPLGYFGGIGKSAREGILVKGSNFLDALREATTVAFDKTGTLTKGVFRVTEVETRNSFSKDEVLKYAALAEAHSNHPIAKAIKDAYGSVEETKIEEYEEIAGHGVRARINGSEIMVGNDKLLHKYNIEHDVCNVKGTVVHAVVNGKYAGYIIISDEIKEDSPLAVKELKRLGVKRVVMVTGDNRDVAEDIAKKLGIDEFYAELLPEDKVNVVEELKKKKDGRVTFVGDGINDAPVLARADVGVAMGALGSDAAIETADVVIMDDKPSKLPKGIKIARKTWRIVWQNIILALGVKLAFIALGIAGKATMWEAVFADVGVAIIAVFNAMRILR